MLDNINQTPKLISESQSTAFGSGKNILDFLLQLRTNDSGCSAFSLRKINETCHSLRVPSCFLPGKLPAGCSSIAIVFTDTKPPKPYPRNSALDGNDTHELWNEAAISNALLISKIENHNLRLTVTEPVNFAA